MNTVIKDLKYGLKMLLVNRGFSAVAIIALALGIGATTAIFSVVNSVLLRPLPYQEPDRLMQIREYQIPKHPDGFSVAPASFMDWREQNTTFTDMGAYRTVSYNLTGTGLPERVLAGRLTAGLITMLGVAPAQGRDFTLDEDRPGNDKVVVLSHGLWQRWFGGDPQILGKPLVMDGVSYTIIGVMPPSFSFPNQNTELWTPMAFEDQLRQAYGAHFVSVIGRVKPGLTIEQAQADLDTIAAGIREDNPDSNTGWYVKAQPMLEFAVGNLRPILMFLLGAVGCVLLIACANVANLLLARAASRQREIAIRTALGAPRTRIIRQLLTESILLAIIGGGLGLLLAAWGIDALMSLAPENLPRVKEVGIDSRVLLFTISVTVFTGVLFGLAPALQASKPDLNETLKESGRGTSEGRRRLKLRNALVVAEVALAIVPLIGGGLLIRSLFQLQTVDPGFNPENALTIRVDLPANKYPKNEQRINFFNQLIERTAALPGVEAVGAAQTLPLAGDHVLGLVIEGQEPTNDGDRPVTNYYSVTPDYFRAMGIKLVKGRAFNIADTSASKRVCVINETLAARSFPDQDPIGKRIHVTNGPETFREVVGVVGDVKQYGLDKMTTAQFYEPLAQYPFPGASVIVRSSKDLTALAATIRNQVLELDSEQAVGRTSSLDKIVATSIAQQRFNTLLLTIFSAVALALAAVGLYGVISYSVTQRRHEIGIRMALGASSSNVMKMVLGQGMALAVIGSIIGIAASLVITRSLSSWLSGMLFKVGANDAITFLLIPAILIAVALVASYIPARRATRVDPMVALRYE